MSLCSLNYLNIHIALISYCVQGGDAQIGGGGGGPTRALVIATLAIAVAAAASVPFSSTSRNV